jgi:hypothetical protein
MIFKAIIITVFSEVKNVLVMNEHWAISADNSMDNLSFQFFSLLEKSLVKPLVVLFKVDFR